MKRNGNLHACFPIVKNEEKMMRLIKYLSTLSDRIDGFKTL